MIVISARLAPLPPSRNFCSLLPSSNAKTYLSGMDDPPNACLRPAAYRRRTAGPGALFLGVGDHEGLREPVVEGLRVGVARHRRDEHHDDRAYRTPQERGEHVGREHEHGVATEELSEARGR